MELAGAQVVPFSPVHDKELPAVDGLYIGGGYPELYAAELSRNSSMLASIKRAHERGLPIYAECGGLMYLAREIDWDGERHDMVGLVPGSVRKGQIRVVSYVSGKLSRDCLLGRQDRASWAMSSTTPSLSWMRKSRSSTPLRLTAARASGVVSTGS